MRAGRSEVNEFVPPPSGMPATWHRPHMSVWLADRTGRRGRPRLRRGSRTSAGSCRRGRWRRRSGASPVAPARRPASRMRRAPPPRRRSRGSPATPARTRFLEVVRQRLRDRPTIRRAERDPADTEEPERIDEARHRRDRDPRAGRLHPPADVSLKGQAADERTRRAAEADGRRLDPDQRPDGIVHRRISTDERRVLDAVGQVDDGQACHMDRRIVRQELPVLAVEGHVERHDHAEAGVARSSGRDGISGCHRSGPSAGSRRAGRAPVRRTGLYREASARSDRAGMCSRMRRTLRTANAGRCLLSRMRSR